MLRYSPAWSENPVIKRLTSYACHWSEDKNLSPCSYINLDLPGWRTSFLAAKKFGVGCRQRSSGMLSSSWWNVVAYHKMSSQELPDCHLGARAWWPVPNGIISSMLDEEKLPCSEKIAFETRVAAETTATTSDYWYGSRPHAYKCHHCHLWHLSSS